jgi:hypothetical protein
MKTKCFLVFSSFFILTVLLVSCKNNEVVNSEGVYPPQVFYEILVDIHLAEASQRLALLPNLSSDGLQKLLADILLKHKTDTTEFNRSFKWYSAHPEEFSKVYENVITEFSKMKAQAAAGELK